MHTTKRNKEFPFLFKIDEIKETEGRTREKREEPDIPLSLRGCHSSKSEENKDEIAAQLKTFYTTHPNT